MDSFIMFIEILLGNILEHVFLIYDSIMFVLLFKSNILRLQKKIKNCEVYFPLHFTQKYLNQQRDRGR